MFKFAHDKELNLFGVGETISEAEKDLDGHFWYYYHYYKDTPDKDLTQQGLELKRKFLARREVE